MKIVRSMSFHRKFFLGIVSVNLMYLLIFFYSSCESDYFPPPPKPKVPVQTIKLEATFSNTPPTSINNSFWSKSDFIKVNASDVSTMKLYGDGLLNMTGTYNGTSDFNDGNNAEIEMRAAYDDQKLYILMEWIDSDINISRSSWLHNGPSDPLKSDTTGGWTSQGNSDKISLIFDINGASGSAGNFSDVGCMASCHNGQMQPQSGLVDIWNWDATLSEPMGYAFDMNADGIAGFTHDTGQTTFSRNNNGTTDRSGPEYEWDGVTQEITRPDGSTAILDPAYFLFNKTAFLGNVESGDTIYTNHCASCHGSVGQGGDGPPFNNPKSNRLSRTNFDNIASSQSDHTGYTYYAPLSAQKREDLIAKIRGLSGVPGNFLRVPTGSASDVSALSNVFVSNISNEQNHTVYKVLLIRDLETNNPDDVQFTQPEGKDYVFGIALMDNDGLNHIGSSKETIYFKQK